MPGKVRVKILAGRNLPVMDRSSDTTDAYVEIKFGSATCKTDVYRKSLHPQWNSDWFRFEASIFVERFSTTFSNHLNLFYLFCEKNYHQTVYSPNKF